MDTTTFLWRFLIVAPKIHLRHEWKLADGLCDGGIPVADLVESADNKLFQHIITG